jgi:hypothetical protein
LALAVVDDPMAALWDGVCRLRNAAGRLLSRRGRVAMGRPPFATLDPRTGWAARPDRLTRRRLAALGQLDKAEPAPR